MSASTGKEPEDSLFVERALQATIRIALVLLLVAWCFTIFRPFLVPVVWAIIIAVATFPMFDWLQRTIGGRRVTAGFAYALLALVALILPTVLLALQIVDNAPKLAAALTSGDVSVPPPPERVASWPFIGEQVFDFWELASVNLQEAIGRLESELKALGAWLLALAGNVLIAVLQFAVAIVIAVALMVNERGGARVADEVALRLVGERGPEFTTLGRTTIRSVARGIIGIALIQAVLAGIGFMAIGLPGAGMLALLVLVLAVVQVGPALVIIPVIIYQFSVADTTPAVLFAVYGIFVTVLDNVLKPVLLGRGVRVPMLVIFVGAIGGLLSAGILGLFVGPVVLAVGFTLFNVWLSEVREESGVEARDGG